MSWIFGLGKGIIFFYGIFVYCMLFFGKACEHYICVVTLGRLENNGFLCGIFWL